MTVLGKILVFVVLVLSLLWTFLTASAFAARTNWQAQAKRYQEEATKAAASATAMKALLDQEREAADERVRVIRADRDRYAATTEVIAQDRAGLLKQYNDLLESTKKQTAEVQPLIGQKQKLIDEVAIKDEQIRQKDAELNALKLSEQGAVVRANERANEAKAQTDRANRLADEVQKLNEALATIRSAGGVTRPGTATAVRVPAPDSFRATVSGVQQNGGSLLVTINQGLDAGLQRNTELTLARYAGDRSQYLGKLLITGVNPKSAVGQFVPPAGYRQTPDERPRAGDTATPSNQ